LLFRSVVDHFAQYYSQDLKGVRLSEEDWDAIKLVLSWLEEFAEVTALMSSASDVTISSVVLIFLSLFEKLEEAFASLPLRTRKKVKDGLSKAHQKLAKYYDKSDAFPYY
ncbi:hypothetical protein BT69DRAFT_1188513, partial [Atractiella rhizophila]